MPTWYPWMCLISFPLKGLLLRMEFRTLTAAYMVWSSRAIAMRPRRIAGPPIKFRLVAAGEDWNTLTPRKLQCYSTRKLHRQSIIGQNKAPLLKECETLRQVHLPCWSTATDPIVRKEPERCPAIFLARNIGVELSRELIPI